MAGCLGGLESAPSSPESAEPIDAGGGSPGSPGGSGPGRGPLPPALRLEALFDGAAASTPRYSPTSPAESSTSSPDFAAALVAEQPPAALPELPPVAEVAVVPWQPAAELAVEPPSPLPFLAYAPRPRRAHRRPTGLYGATSNRTPEQHAAMAQLLTAARCSRRLDETKLRLKQREQAKAAEAADQANVLLIQSALSNHSLTATAPPLYLPAGFGRLSARLGARG